MSAETFACRVINLTSKGTDTSDLESSMGDMISKFSSAKVCLDDPDIEIYLIFTDKESFFGFSTRYVRLKRPTKVNKKPHELDWKLCRAMINLSGLKEGDTVCDPFCGTGTTLLEAEAMGIHSIGIDFDGKMYEISKENLHANGFNSKVIRDDFTFLKKIQDKFDGLVTDLPYGRASKLSDIPEKMLEKFISMIPNKKKVVIMCKKGTEQKINFKPSKRYDIYRHKSLTRTILVK